MAGIVNAFDNSSTPNVASSETSPPSSNSAKDGETSAVKKKQRRPLLPLQLGACTLISTAPPLNGCNEDGRITPGTELANIFEYAGLNPGLQQDIFRFEEQSPRSPVPPSPIALSVSRRRSLSFSPAPPPVSTGQRRKSILSSRRRLSVDTIRSRSVSPVSPSTCSFHVPKPRPESVPVSPRRKYEEDEGEECFQFPVKFRAVTNDRQVKLELKRTQSSLGFRPPVSRAPSPLTRSNTLCRNNGQGKGLRRTISMPQSINVSSFSLPDIENPKIRGDGMACGLPTVQDDSANTIRLISPSTLCDALQGKYSNMYDEVVVIDARFPYEYEHGHIKGAVNLWKFESILDRLYGMPAILEGRGDRVAVIFHCEFSSYRAPTALKYIRNLDRKINLACYPALHLPELYMLKGGYKNFFASCKDFCTPAQYLRMDNADFANELLEYEKISKRCNQSNVQLENSIAERINL